MGGVMGKDYILGIDQGSTGTKVIAADQKGNIVDSAYRKIKSICPFEGWLQHDPEEIWDSVRECLEELAGRLDFGAVLAIGITNQRETSVLWERETGKAVTPAVSWQCARSAEIVRRWEEFADEILEKTGLNNNTYFSASKIAWFLEQDPSLRSRCEAGEICFGNMNTWLIWKLTGGKSHVTDTSNAGRTLFFDVKKGRWDESLISKMKIPTEILPEVRPCDSNFGMAVAPEDLFKEPVPILASIGDQMSALFGQACFSRGEAKCTIGTCLNLVAYTGKYEEPQAGILPAVAADESGKITYELEGGVYVAGSLNEWLINQLGIASSPGEISELAMEAGSSDGVYLVPAFQGLGAPHWNSGARALIIGLSFYHDKKHICRAAVESMALQTYDVLETLEKQFGLDIQTLKVDGGVAKNDFIMQVFADVLNCRIERPVITDCTSMGAIYLAGLSGGMWKDKSEVRSLWKKDHVFEPSMDPTERKRLISGWKEAVKRSFDWVRQVKKEQ